jgi:hypothetical protein
MKNFVWFLILLLVVLHQDNWNWDDATLVFGFMPMGLFYHACISVAAAVVWLLAVKFCWPHELDDLGTVRREGDSA